MSVAGVKRVESLENEGELVPIPVSLAAPIGKQYQCEHDVAAELEARGVHWIGEIRQQELRSGPHWVVALVDIRGRTFVDGLGSSRHVFAGFKLLVLWERRR